MIVIANILVVGIRPELRYMLRVTTRTHVWAAETFPQFRKNLTGSDIRLVIIDCRDAPILAKRAANYLRRLPRQMATILIASSEEQRREPVCDVTLREGIYFYDRLRGAVRLAVIRRPGPLPRVFRPVEQRIGSELVRIAPAAIFGAEMLEAREEESRK